MGEETVDTLELVIQTKAWDAAKAVRELATSVETFGKNVSEHIASLGTFADALERIVRAVNGLSKVNNLKSVIGNVATVAGTAKEKVVGKALAATSATASTRVGGWLTNTPATTVKGGTRLVRFPDGSVRRFNTSASDIASSVNKAYGGTGYTNKELAEKIVGIRNGVISGSSTSMNDIMALSRELASSVGRNRTSSLIEKLNGITREYGSRTIGVTDKDIAGFGMPLKDVNALMRDVGARARFRKGGAMGPDEIAQALGLERYNAEDLLEAIQKDSLHNSGLTTVLGENSAHSTDELVPRIFEELVEKIYSSVNVDMQKAETKAAVEAAKAAAGRGVTSIEGKQFWEMYNARMGIGSGSGSKWKGYGDRTAPLFSQLLDAEDAKENEAYLDEMKTVAEDIVKSQTVGGVLDTKTIIEETTGISKAWKDAEDSARAMMDLLNQPEVINSAKESARAYQDAFRADEAKAYSAEMDKIGERMETIRQERERADLAAALADNTPSLIATRRSAAQKKGKLEGFDKLFTSSIPGLVQRGLDAGLIDQKTADEMLQAAGYAKDLAPAVEEAKQAMEGTGSAAKEAADGVKEISESAEEAKGSSITLKSVMSAVGKTISKSIVGQLARVAKMRALRWVVKSVASALKEGTENMYQWSKGISGHFAGAMDTAASKIMLAKNSVATAFAPVIENVLIPLLSQVVSWVNAASNAIAQFMAIATGQDTWTKALETTEEWAAATKNATGSAKNNIKDLLADWDELNIIQSKTSSRSGSGSSKKTSDYSKMFTETNVFDDWTKSFDEIRNIVNTIGIGIAGWFVGSQISDFLDKIGIASAKVSKIKSLVAEGFAGAILLSVGFNLAGASGKSIALSGLNGVNIASSLGGMLASGLGGYFVGNAIGGLLSMFGIATGPLGMIGTIMGVGIAIALEANAYIQAMHDNAKEYIREKLESEVYGFDVDAKIEELHVLLSSAAQVRNAVRSKLEKTMTTMRVIKLGIDTATTWSTLYDDVMNDQTGLLARMRTELEEDKSIITFYYQLQQKAGTAFSDTDENGNYTNLESFKLDMKAAALLEEHYNNLGKRFAECFTDGETGELKKGKEEVALEIAKQIVDIERAAEEALEMAEIEIDTIKKLKGTNRETVMNEFDDTFKEYEKKLADARRESAESAYKSRAAIIARMKAAGLDPDLVKQEEDALKELKDELENTDYTIQVHIDVAENEKNVILDFIKKNYSDVNLGQDDYTKSTIVSDLVNARTQREFGYETEDFPDLFSRLLMEYANRHYGLDSGDQLFQTYGIGIEDLFDVDSLKGMRDLLIENGFGLDEVKEIFSGAGLGSEILKEIFKDAELSDGTKDKMQEEVEEALTPVNSAAGAIYGGYGATTEKEHALGFTPEQRKALEDYWDAFKTFDMTNFSWEEFQRITALSDALDNAFGGDTDVTNALADSMETLDRSLENLPTDWFEDPVLIDPAASGMVTESSFNESTASVTTVLGQLVAALPQITKLLENIDESSATTARKNFVVNVGASSGFGQIAGRSQEMFNRVTGANG